MAANALDAAGNPSMVIVNPEQARTRGRDDERREDASEPPASDADVQVRCGTARLRVFPLSDEGVRRVARRGALLVDLGPDDLSIEPRFVERG
jgi:hypothetical protein